MRSILLSWNPPRRHAATLSSWASAARRKSIVALGLMWLGLGAAPLRAESIVDVLERSQRMQIQALREMQVDEADPKARIVRASFEKVLGQLVINPDVPLLVVRGPLLAVCLMGRMVAANENLADLSESEREFILAHELGHIAHAHWAQLGDLYQQYIPGEVTREQTDAVAATLSREASGLAHRHEYEADAFALRLLRRLGEPDDTPVVLFQQRLPMVKTTATHPGTAQRLAHLQELR